MQARLVAAVTGGPAPPGAPVADRYSLPWGETPPDHLTQGEAQVLTLIATGLPNAEIGERLFLERATVKTHVNRIFAKTGVRDRARAARYAFEAGLASPEPTIGIPVRRLRRNER